MSFSLKITKNDLLPALLLVSGAVDKRQSLPILSNLLFRISDHTLTLSATDLEIEITASLTTLTDSVAGEITVPAKKVIDILRSLDDQSTLTLSMLEDQLSLKSGRSKFKLATLAANNFPSIDRDAPIQSFTLSKTSLIHVLHTTYFAMSQQDVRVYLNGLLLEFQGHTVVSVASDAHRMAICKLEIASALEGQRLLLPRKAVLELLRLLSTTEDSELTVVSGQSTLRVETSTFHFTTKLIESRFPFYNKAIPIDNTKFLIIDKESLKRALSRIIILANEKSHAIILTIEPSAITIVANNQDQEEATESVEAQVDGESLSIGINATYLLDVLQHIPEETVRISLSTKDRSVLVEPLLDENYQYVIMPMSL